jgi:predicted secreted protein
MAVIVETTPNPAARKFTVGVPVGGPATFTTGQEADAWVVAILRLPGVTSLFFTADFVTVTGGDGVDWEAIIPDIVSTLDLAFS